MTGTVKFVVADYLPTVFSVNLITSVLYVAPYRFLFTECRKPSNKRRVHNKRRGFEDRVLINNMSQINAGPLRQHKIVRIPAIHYIIFTRIAYTYC